MVYFQGTVEKVNSRKDKTYQVYIGTQEMEGKEIGDIMALNQEFVNVILIQDDPKLMARLLAFLNEEKEK